MHVYLCIRTDLRHATHADQNMRRIHQAALLPSCRHRQRVRVFEFERQEHHVAPQAARAADCGEGWTVHWKVSAGAWRLAPVCVCVCVCMCMS